VGLVGGMEAAGLKGLMGVAEEEAERRARRGRTDGRRLATCLRLSILPNPIRGQVLQPAKKKKIHALLSVVCLRRPTPPPRAFLFSLKPPSVSELWTPLKINHLGSTSLLCSATDSLLTTATRLVPMLEKNIVVAHAEMYSH
jgi:hypothetical protein